jgi:hypothetical protein
MGKLQWKEKDYPYSTVDDYKCCDEKNQNNREKQYSRIEGE